MTLDDLTAANAALAAEVQDVYARRAALIRRAREDGHTWQQIATALDMTAHGAIKASRMGSN